MSTDYALVFAGVSPIGAFLTGSIAEAFGPAIACAVGGGLGLACVLGLSLRWTRTTDTHTEERAS